MYTTDKNLAKSWLFIWVTNATVIYLVSFFYPSAIVLGNAVLPNWVGLIVASLLLTLFLILVIPVVKTLKLKVGNDLSWSLIYGTVNIIGLWLLARIAAYTGFGISSVLVAIVLGIILNTIQYGIWKMLTGKKIK